MKRSITVILFFLIIHPVFSQGFTVKSFTADITLNPEGYFDVIESYEVEFNEYKHGLLRNILTQYDLTDERGKKEKRTLYITDIDVIGHKFSVSGNRMIEIRIGDPNQTIIGPQHYEIRYRVKNGYIFSDDLVQFYWSIKPADWDTVFEKVEFKITGPEEAIFTPDNSFVYSGFYGTEEVSEDFEYDYSENIFTSISREEKSFHMGEDVTVLMKMPREMIAEIDYSPGFIEEYGWIGILLFLLGIFYLVWLKYGKDNRVVALTGYYPPEGVDSAMAGYLIDDKSDSNDLISLIPKWGAEGVIQVEDIPKKGFFGKSDTKIIRLGEISKDAPDYEKTMFYGLFSDYKNVSHGKILDAIQSALIGDKPVETPKTLYESILISDLKESFYTTMNKAKQQLRNEAQIYYNQRSNTVMYISMTVSVLLLIVLTPLLGMFYGINAGIGSVIVCLFMAGMSFFMRKKNPDGNDAYSELKGFRNFVKLAETNRIKTLIQSDPDYFEKTMSYALAFGLLKQWAGKFDALDIRPPEWYNTSAVGVASMNSFANSFSSSMSSAKSAMVSVPSSSGSGGGGGFSGGGFGGGGGGSW